MTSHLLQPFLSGLLILHYSHFLDGWTNLEYQKASRAGHQTLLLRQRPMITQAPHPHLLHLVGRRHPHAEAQVLLAQAVGAVLALVVHPVVAHPPAHHHHRVQSRAHQAHHPVALGVLAHHQAQKVVHQVVHRLLLVVALALVAQGAVAQALDHLHHLVKAPALLHLVAHAGAHHLLVAQCHTQSTGQKE